MLVGALLYYIVLYCDWQGRVKSQIKSNNFLFACGGDGDCGDGGDEVSDCRSWWRVPGVWQSSAVWLYSPEDPHLPHRGRHEGRHLLSPGPGRLQRVPDVRQPGGVPLSLHYSLLLSLPVLWVLCLRLQDELPWDVHLSSWRGQYSVLTLSLPFLNLVNFLA